jgi:hypothetical protein
MKRLITLIFSTLPVWGIAADDLQCNRVFPEGQQREQCVTVTLTRPSWADEDLSEAVVNRMAAKQAEQAKEARRGALETQREVLKKRLEAATNKSNAMHLKLLKPGMTVADVKTIYPKMQCSEQSQDELSECSYMHTPLASDAWKQEELETLAGIAVTVWSLSFDPAGRLAQIHIRMSSGAFDELVKALSVKYEKPAKVTVRSYQNAFGAKFQGREAHWNKGTSILDVDEYSGSRDVMAITLSTRAGADAIAKFKARDAKRAAKDL